MTREETLATAQAVWDVYVEHPMPVLGEPEPIFTSSSNCANGV